MHTLGGIRPNTQGGAKSLRGSLASPPSSSLGGMGGREGFSTIRASSRGEPRANETRPNTTSRLIDKSSIVWKDFITGCRKRTRLVAQVRQLGADETTTPSVLKKYLLDLRQLSLKIIEDALEIEYRSQLGKPGTFARNIQNIRLPPITTYKTIQNKDDLYMLVEMINDLEDLYKLPNIRVILPMEFPSLRNPFLLGKNVDDLALMQAPAPTPGKLEEELKVLELLRYKRAAKALLRAEAQVLNKLPINLADVEKLWFRMYEDADIDLVIRGICTLLANENYDPSVNLQGPDLKHIQERTVSIEPHDFLNRLNLFGAANNIQKVRIDIQAIVRQSVKNVNFRRLNDEVSSFLVEWLNSALGQQAATNTGEYQAPMNTLQGGSLFDGSSIDSMLSGVGEGMEPHEYEDTQKMQQMHMQFQQYMQQRQQLTAGEIPRAQSRQGHSRSPSRQGHTKEVERKPPMEKKITKTLTPEEKMADAERRDNIRKNNLKKRNPLPEVKKDEAANLNINPMDLDTIGALRYELMKMQRELLRRKILDPRHYNAQSIDEASKEVKGGSTNASTALTKHGANLIVTRELTLFESEFEVDKAGGNSFKYTIEMIYNIISERINFRVMQVHDAFSIMFDPAYTVGEKMLVHRLDFTRVLFQKMTGSTFDVFLKDEPHIRGQKLEKLISHLEKITKKQQDSEEGRELDIYAPVDRDLYNATISVDKIGVDVLITRNDACTGLIVKCSPQKGAIAGQAGGGAVTLEIYDKELMVLLINQRSMFELARTKWSSLKILADWLVTLIRVQRVYVKPESEHPEDNKKGTRSRPISAVSFDTSVGEENNVTAKDREEKTNADLSATIVHQSEEMVVDKKENKVDEALQTMLNVHIDRNVPIDRTAFLQWRSRHCPRISGLNCKLVATQDRETLVFEVIVKVPHPKSLKGDEMLNFSKFYEDDEFFDTVDTTIYPPSIHQLSYALTGQELMIFGAAKAMEEHNVAISSLPGKHHPAEFMFNIMNRLNIIFKGDISDPYNRNCSATFGGSWDIEFDRKLFRDIRTISGGVMMVTASVIGGEILFDANPTDGSIFKEVGSKLMEATDLEDLCFGEGWPLEMLDPAQRNNFAYRTLEKLKVVQEKQVHRLELYNYPEVRLLMVTQRAPNGKLEKLIGSVEINEFLTLTDLRIVLQHELDRERIPRSYQFHYKGSACAFRQESMRRAWDLLPKCALIPRKGNEPKKEDDEKGKDDKKDEASSKLSSKMESDLKRKYSNKLAPVPILTLVRVQEENGVMHLLGDRKDFIQTGDVLKIGNIKGQDYTVSFMDYKTAEKYPKMVVVAPAFNMLSEVEFEVPTTGIMPWPKPDKLDASMRKWIPRGLKKRGITYDLPKKPVVEKTQEEQFKGKKVAPAGTDSKDLSAEANQAISRAKSKKIVKDEPDDKPQIKEEEDGGIVWQDVWLWKMKPNGEDTRPKWRQRYDNGEIKYEYEYQKSDEGIKYFGIHVPYAIMEIVCTDCRIPEYALHHQRIEWMNNLGVEDYTKMAFEKMTNWFPQFDEGIELHKFMKMLKDCQCFPDIRKPARIGQLENLFQEEMKTDDAIVEKYINYKGFCRLLQEVALIRYPPGQKNDKKNKDKGDDESTLASADDMSTGGDSMASGLTTPSAISLRASTRGDKALARAKKNSEASIASNNERVMVSPEEAAAAYRNFVTDFLLNIKDWSNTIWGEAKLKTMQKEALLYASVTKIIAVYRGNRLKYYYQIFKYAILTLQSYARMRIAMKKTKATMKILFEDWLFRVRYYGATMVQSIVRRYIALCRKIKIYKRLNEQQVKIFKANRKRKAKLREKARAAIIYKVIQKIEGLAIMICIKRRDQRSYSKDYSMVVEVYVPKSQETFKFEIEEEELRKFICLETGLEVLNNDQLLDKRNLGKVISARLILKGNKAGLPPRVMFSKQALGQKGTKKCTRGKILGRDLFVCSLFESSAETVVQCYHRMTSKVFEARIASVVLIDWISSDYKKNCKNEVDLYKTPPLLHESNARKKYFWMIDNLIVDTRRGQFKVIFACQLEKSNKLHAVIQFQSLFRRAIVRLKVPHWLDTYMVKVKSSSDPRADCYYINKYDGSSSWERPRLLRGNELPSQPSHRWEEVWHYDEEGNASTYYVNPINGLVTHLSMDRAARIIQAVARMRRLEIHYLPVDVFARAVRFEREAYDKYIGPKKSLANLVNYAITQHLHVQDAKMAREIYEKAMNMTDTNPLVLRAYGVFLLAACDAPLVPNRDRALAMIKDATARDPQHLQFKTCYNLGFKYGCYKNPFSPMSYLYLGLASFYVLRDQRAAEKALRRAVLMSPFDEKILENWKLLRSQFPDKMLQFLPKSRTHNALATLKGGKNKPDTKQIHGLDVYEDPEWAGWTYYQAPAVEEDEAAKQEESYWYNPVTGEKREDEPHWQEEWEIRKARSRYDGTADDLESYFDTFTSAHFQYHALTDSYQ